MILLGQHTDIHPQGSFVERCLGSARAALATTEVDVTDSAVVIILSTTKGDNLDLFTPAQCIAEELGNPNLPIVVSNACTSGVSAQVVAYRLLKQGVYRHAVIIGCDLISDFIRSGFNALHALDPNPCRPFDVTRQGLNLGEAVATMVVGQKEEEQQAAWEMLSGAIHNDANHITGPSRTGEGSYRCLCDILRGQNMDNIMLVSLHGTGTLYNDEMEAQAIHRAGLQLVPVNSLKGFYGHTLGAAGLLETLLNMQALEQGKILPTKGFNHLGTTLPLCLCSEVRQVEKDKSLFVKLLSGFGGVNAAVLWQYHHV